MTHQEVFEKVANHLIRQNAVSQYRDNLVSHCAYRGEGGRMCAIGALIKDEHYDGSLEGNTPLDEMVQNALKLSGVPVTESYIDLMEELQAIHDYSPPEKWRARLIQFADDNGFDDAFLKTGETA